MDVELIVVEVVVVFLTDVVVLEVVVVVVCGLVVVELDVVVVELLVDVVAHASSAHNMFSGHPHSPQRGTSSPCRQ